MADDLSGAVRRALADAVRGVVGGRATVTRGTGTYVRTDADGTGWVLMAGADEPTPVNGRALIDAEPGDSVQWELDGTALSVTGNATTPAVGTRQVTREVKPVAERARDAYDEAVRARDAADTAEADAVRAHAAADSAANSARTANGAANSALTQLSVVEDVAGTLQWISDHGTFTATTDTTVQEGVVYFAYDGGDYVPIAEPAGDPSAQGWYVLDVSESQTEYVMSHIAVTSRGLWVLPSGIGSAADEQHAAGYKLLLASDGSYLYDSDGQLVTASGESITLSSSRPQYIGGENAYIIYYDSDDDGIPDTIRIGGRVLMGGSKTLSEVLSELEAATSTEVVGRNLLRRTGSVTTADLARTRSSVPEAGVIRLNPTATGDALAKFKVDYLDFSDYGEGTYTVSFDAREVDDSSGFESGQELRAYLGFSIASRIGSTFSSSYDRYTQKNDALTSDWARYAFTSVVPDDIKSGKATALVAGSQLSVELFRYRGYLPAEVRHVKLERGERATAWTLAPEDLVGITSTTVAYGTSASASTEPSAWQATAPTVTQGQWLWTRTVTAYTDGTSTTSYSKSYVGTDGTNGTDGEDGTGITSIVEQYYLSTSNSTQTGGSWSNNQPAWQSGRYIWTRSQITWDTTPATVTTTTPVLAQALNGANSTASSANATATEAAKRTYVSIRVTAIDYDANTATLQATLFIDGTAKTSGVTYAWLKDGSAISGATARAYSVPASNGLDHAYSCKCTW